MAAVYAKRPGTPLGEQIAAWPWAALARHTLHLLALAGMVAALVWGWRAIHDPWNFPLRVVKVDGELQHLKPQAVQMAVDERLQGSFFGVELTNVLRGLTDLAWIRDARVRREWPDKLHLWVEEHKPLALWRGDAVLTADGSLIYPENKREDDRQLENLPALSGADGREMALWNEFNRLGGLLQPTGLRVVALREDQRGSQTLVLEHGLTLRLGREDVEKRLQRFLDVFDRTLASRIGEVEEVDLRYANGFSVRMRAAGALSKSFENRMLATEDTESTEGRQGLRVSHADAGQRTIPHGLGGFISESSVCSVAKMDFKPHKCAAVADVKTLSRAQKNRMLATEGTESTEGKQGLRVSHADAGQRTIPHGLGGFLSESSVCSVANTDFNFSTRNQGNTALVAMISTAAFEGEKHGQKVG